MFSSEFATIDNLFLQDIKSIIATGRQKAYNSVNATMIQTYWLIGQRIVEEEQKGMNRAEYGKTYHRSTLKAAFQRIRARILLQISSFVQTILSDSP